MPLLALRSAVASLPLRHLFVPKTAGGKQELPGSGAAAGASRNVEVLSPATEVVHMRPTHPVSTQTPVLINGSRNVHRENTEGAEGPLPQPRPHFCCSQQSSHCTPWSPKYTVNSIATPTPRTRPPEIECV
eukprot:Gregarina_sp_Poly_1__5266@NODE_278_length_10191_cov_434_260174_g242_i0_p8_GENE_NODE_278_length_10191_cov_434_260174_g242_i0NODE_278_length_10191_cov_434_260174_g242_i0_p8_ORF_typecomplete_len131_score11_30_NODE_278_length_10191_cov_434_260174_g242_i021402532